jgi:YVTN family beta-propeller protein
MSLFFPSARVGAWVLLAALSGCGAVAAAAESAAHPAEAGFLAENDAAMNKMMDGMAPQVAEIPTGNLPHGIWPSGDGSRMYVGLENADALAAIDTASNKVVANVPIGQAPQALAYVSNAVAEGDGLQNLQALGIGHWALRDRVSPAVFWARHG